MEYDKIRNMDTTKPFVNKLADSHIGLLPVRVLQHNLIWHFENMNEEFLELSKRVITQLKLDRGISYNFEERPARSPHVLFNKIFIEEPFLAYVWCVSYSLTVLYGEVIVKLSLNDYHKNHDEVIDRDLAIGAYSLWEYAVSLLGNYSDWNKKLPNPEQFDPNLEELISKVNGLYLVAMKFILAHELAHLELEHNKKEPDDSKIEEAAFSKLLEKEADERAMNLVLAGSNDESRTSIKMGILLGLCSLVFTNMSIKGISHPDTDDRIAAIIDVFNPGDTDPMWGVATLTYKLWDKQYNKGLVWQNGLESPKALYYSIKVQIEKLK
jgi:hypothetical protein